MAERTEQRARTAEALVDHLLATGLSETSLRQLAAAAGVSDRMLIYYFGSKAAVLEEALACAAARMEAALGGALPPGTRLTVGQLFAAILAAFSDPHYRPYMALWIEIIGQSFRAPETLGPVAERIGTTFRDWAAERLEGDDPGDRQAAAGMVLAMVDGLVMIEACLPEGETEPVRAALQAALESGLSG